MYKIMGAKVHQQGSGAEP